MTTRFEQVESGATTSAMDPVIAKFQSEYQNIARPGDATLFKVADQQGQAPDGGDNKSPLKGILAEDPKDLSANLKVVQGLASHFDKSDDKAKALGEVKPQMEKTIAGADAAQAATVKQAEADFKTLKPKLDADKQEYENAGAPLQAAAKNIKQADQERVGSEMQLYADDKTSPALKKALADDLAQYPGLVQAIDGMLAVEKKIAPDLEIAQALQNSVKTAAEDAVISRIVYADMQQQGGDKAGAKQTEAEAMALQMGMTIDQFRQLQQQQKGQQKP